MSYDPELVQNIYEILKLVAELEIKADELQSSLGLDEFNLEMVNEEVTSQFSQEEIELADSFNSSQIDLQNLKYQFNKYLEYYNEKL